MNDVHRQSSVARLGSPGRAALINDITHPLLYRSVQGGPPLWPRHHCHWRVITMDGDTAILAPINSDAEVVASKEDGTNFEVFLRSLWRYFGDPSKATEIPRRDFNILLAYMLHWLAAPAWNDEIRGLYGMQPLGLEEFILDLWNEVENVQTPRELIVFALRMTRDYGLDALTPADASDFDDVGAARERGA